MNDDSSEASHTAAAAISSGSPMRPNRWERPAASRAPSAANMRPAGGVSMAPGQMQFTRMDWRAWSTAMARVRLITAAFDAQYTIEDGSPARPETEAVLM